LYELPLQAASRKENHSLFIIIVEKRLLSYLFLYAAPDKTDVLLLPSTFNNEKRLLLYKLHVRMM